MHIYICKFKNHLNKYLEVKDSNKFIKEFKDHSNKNKKYAQILNKTTHTKHRATWDENYDIWKMLNINTLANLEDKKNVISVANQMY